MKITVVKSNEGASLVGVPASRVVRLEAHGMIKPKLHGRLRDLKFLFWCGFARKNADERGNVSGLTMLNFQVNGTSRLGLDALRSPMHKTSKSRGSSCYCEIRLWVVEDFRLLATLPARDLRLKATAQNFRPERTAIEEDGVDPRSVPKKVRQITSDGAICGIRKRPLSQASLGSGGLVMCVTLREESIENDGVDFCSMKMCGEGFAEQAGSLRGN